MSTLLEFSITPIGKGDSVGSYVARALDVVDRSGLPYRLNPMGTVVEGSWDEVFGLLRSCADALSPDCERLSISVKVDHRRGGPGRLASKTESVERRLGRKLSQ
jgi:uncharacterized protein (TIGR00106 family)